MARIGLQLYSVRTDCAKDLVGTLSKVSKMGYQAVEFAGYHGRDAKQLRNILQDLNLVCCGTHTGLETLLDDQLMKTVEFNAVLGNKYLIVPGLKEEYRNSISAWEKTAEIFNSIAEKIKPYGMKTGYHNHWVEFEELEGKIPMDIFFQRASKDVIMQFDTGNAMRKGGNVIEYLKKFPGRSDTIHIKEFSAANDKAIVGEGDIPWKEVIELCQTIGNTEWYIIEQESYAYEPMECVEKCLINFIKLLKN
ncbi:MAG: sugar phosphate isomerase/epimerase [Candidatus Omnitrophica bacterium]|nr:sugar phosphate isomerase/epimerase [Candidatus Omnitrophota bacterium]